jgi:hypothetical protein
MTAIPTAVGVSRLLKISCWLAVTACGALLLLELMRHGADTASQAVSTCLFRRVVGIPCPGCGMSRAFLALLRGDWSSVRRLHPLAPLLALEWAALWVAVGVWAAGRLALPRPERFAERLILSNAALLVLFWGGRIYFHTLPW